MADAFEHLKLPEVPIDPDRAFASQLRQRIATALARPIGATMSTDLGTEPSAVTRTITRARINPYLAVAGAHSALEWYGRAFGAELVGHPVTMPDGRIGHAELSIGGALLMVAEESPDIGVEAPVPGRGAPVTISIDVDDVDGVFGAALGAGATLERPLADYPYGRNGVLRDPFGHRWLISSSPAQAGPRHGDLGYVSLWVRDVGRATAFFSEVLGWRYRAGSGPEGRQVEGLSLHHGLWVTEADPTLFCCFAVESMTSAVERVLAAGGDAEEPHAEPWGLLSGCTDDQGVSFAIFEPPGGVARGQVKRPNGAVAGDLAYVTMEVPDSARTRDFYGAVLGWTFAPGSVSDGWVVDDVSPMVGISGGHERATTVPMYRVDDIGAAVRAVRDAGGTATDPEAQPYGITSTAVDDQGTRFYLGQL